MRKSVKRALGLGVLAGVTYAAYREYRKRVPEQPKDIEWASAPFPFPPVPRPAPAQPSRTLWAEPNDDGTCPVSHPIKGKTSSGIYHLPGGANYERTHPDRCYSDEDAALRDGLRRSKV
jgi:hypothetical protein